MTKIEILTSHGCSSCAKAKEVIDRVVKDYTGVEVVEINFVQHPEVLDKYPIMASPGIVVDGELKMTGAPKEKQVRAWIEASTAGGG